MIASRIPAVAAALLLAATALAGCATDPDDGDVAPSEAPGPAPELTADDLASLETRTASVVPRTFSCSLECFGWECYNICEGSDGTLCVSTNQWQGGHWGGWSGYSCSQN